MNKFSYTDSSRTQRLFDTIQQMEFEIILLQFKHQILFVFFWIIIHFYTDSIHRHLKLSEIDHRL